MNRRPFTAAVFWLALAGVAGWFAVTRFDTIQTEPLAGFTLVVLALLTVIFTALGFHFLNEARKPERTTRERVQHDNLRTLSDYLTHRAHQKRTPRK